MAISLSIMKFNSLAEKRNYYRNRKGYKGHKLSGQLVTKRMLNNRLEKKFVDSYLPYTMMDRNGNFTRVSYNGIAGAEIIRGTGENNRIGDRIKPVKLELRLSTYYDPSSVGVLANPTHQVRVIIFKWNEDIASVTPTSASILQYPSVGIGAYNQITSPYNHGQVRQADFKIVYDKTFSVGSSSPARVITKKFKLQGNLDFTYNSDAGGGTGHYYVWCSADDASGAHTPSVQLQYHTRLHYVDA